jgi:hypothetical protein
MKGLNDTYKLIFGSETRPLTAKTTQTDNAWEQDAEKTIQTWGFGQPEYPVVVGKISQTLNVNGGTAGVHFL